MTNSFSVITANVINEIIKSNPDKLYELIIKAYLLHEAGKTINPNSHFLHFPHKPKSRIIALPAYLEGEFNTAGIKWIASNPENLKNGLPRASAVIILNDVETGRPVACLEGAIISSTRTAISAIVAAEYLKNKQKKIAKLGIIGNSLITKAILSYLLVFGWEIKEVLLFDLNQHASEKFINSVPHDNVQFKIMSSANQVVSQSDVCILGTTAAEPYLHNKELLAHKPTLLNISLRDLGPELLLNSHNVVDDIEHVLNANTSPHLAQKQYGHHNFINGTLGGLIKGEYQLDQSKPVIFSPMGLGILDLALAKYVYEIATQNGSIISIEDFFLSSM